MAKRRANAKQIKTTSKPKFSPEQISEWRGVIDGRIKEMRGFLAQSVTTEKPFNFNGPVTETEMDSATMCAKRCLGCARMLRRNLQDILNTAADDPLIKIHELQALHELSQLTRAHRWLQDAPPERRRYHWAGERPVLFGGLEACCMHFLVKDFADLLIQRFISAIVRTDGDLAKREFPAHEDHARTGFWFGMQNDLHQHIEVCMDMVAESDDQMIFLPLESLARDLESEWPKWDTFAAEASIDIEHERALRRIRSLAPNQQPVNLNETTPGLTIAKKPEEWAAMFHISADTFKARCKDKTIRSKKLSDRLYMVAVDDLPEEYQIHIGAPKPPADNNPSRLIADHRGLSTKIIQIPESFFTLMRLIRHGRDVTTFDDTAGRFALAFNKPLASRQDGD